ncbi:MAG: histidine phosphatase family protein [Erysipelotrichales bacterium]|nr:histidine phosphatase family protein [Erysipelotrichales bacterium]
MIYLLRHGLDDETYIGGWSDVSLTELGIKQVVETANKIKNSDSITINNIITSDIKRAIETANIVSRILEINNYQVSEFLREQNKGKLNGMIKTLAEDKYPNYFGENLTIDTIYPEGESLKDLYIRIKNNLEFLSSLNDNTLLITHRGVINMLYYILNDIPLDMDKRRFGVDHATLHEFDRKNKSIRKVL